MERTVLGEQGDSYLVGRRSWIRSDTPAEDADLLEEYYFEERTIDDGTVRLTPALRSRLRSGTGA